MGLESNWLPAPENRFGIWLRVYRPGRVILDDRYTVRSLLKRKACGPRAIRPWIAPTEADTGDVSTDTRRAAFAQVRPPIAATGNLLFGLVHASCA